MYLKGYGHFSHTSFGLGGEGEKMAEGGWLMAEGPRSSARSSRDLEPLKRGGFYAGCPARATTPQPLLELRSSSVTSRDSPSKLSSPLAAPSLACLRGFLASLRLQASKGRAQPTSGFLPLQGGHPTAPPVALTLRYPRPIRGSGWVNKGWCFKLASAFCCFWGANWLFR